MARWGTKGVKSSSNVQFGVTAVAAASSPRRAKVYHWTIGSSATPADTAFVHIAQRCTSTGTGGVARTPNALDPADTLASTIVVTEAVTTDPSITAGAFLLWKAVNQRSTIQWNALPYGELLIPATASNGIAFGLSAASTTVVDYDLNYEEL